MMSRISFLATVAASLIALTVLPLLAAEGQAKEATVVKAGEGKITLTFKGDTKEHTHDVAKDAAISLDDKTVKLEELKAGFVAHVRIDDKFVVTKIHAMSKKK